MRILQYAYLAVGSQHLTAQEMAARIGIEPDEVLVRGSRSTDPVRPWLHKWKVVCRDRGLAVDAQVERVVARLAPRTDQIAALAAEIDAREGGRSASLHIVRFLDHEDGEEEDLGDPDAERVKPAGQHQLLGWHLDRRVLEFLYRIGAEVDADEYG